MIWRQNSVRIFKWYEPLSGNAIIKSTKLHSHSFLMNKQEQRHLSAAGKAHLSRPLTKAANPVITCNIKSKNGRNLESWIIYWKSRQIRGHCKVKKKKNRTRNQPIWLCNEQTLAFALFGKPEASALRRSKTVQGGMRADEVVKNTNMEMRLFAGANEEKPCLVLYQALNCLLKHSISLLVISSPKLCTRMRSTSSNALTVTLYAL